MHLHKLRPFFKNNWQVMLIILAFVLINLATLSFYRDVWWDSSVYIGMGKYIYSSGESGLWEPIRPLLLPLILGFFWKIGLDPLIYGKMVALLFSIGTIILTYLLSIRLFGKQTALIASIILSFSALMLNISHQILVEIPAVFFLLLGFYFYISNKNFIAGLCFGFAFLTKFPSIFFLFALIGTESSFLLPSNKNSRLIRFKAILTVAAVFVMTVMPYFIFNHFYYGDAFFPLKSAKHVIDNAVGCTVFGLKPAYYYFPLLLKDNPLHISFIFGLWLVLLNKNKKYKVNKVQIIAYIAAFSIYFTLLVCKTDRYPLLVLPFISMITGYGLSAIPGKLRNKGFQTLIVLLVFLISLSLSIIYIKNNTIQKNDHLIFSYFSGKNASGEILTTTPQISAFTDSKLNLIYYDIYNSETPDYYIKYIAQNKEQIAYAFVNTNDIPCHPDDLECPAKTKHFIEFLRSNFKTVHVNIGNSEYLIFSRQQ